MFSDILTRFAQGSSCTCNGTVTENMERKERVWQYHTESRILRALLMESLGRKTQCDCSNVNIKRRFTYKHYAIKAALRDCLVSVQWLVTMGNDAIAEYSIQSVVVLLTRSRPWPPHKFWQALSSDMLIP